MMVLLSSVLLMACRDAPPQAETRPPDILVVVLDTVRRDRLSAYGNPRPTSPALSWLASRGVRFTDVTSSASWTWPSHASLFTAQPPWVHGAHAGAGASNQVELAGDRLSVTPMRRDLPTLPDAFGAAGYRTVALSANRLLSPALGLTRGFQQATFLDSDQAVLRAVSETLAQDDERPLFLFVNLMAAHSPYEAWPASWLSDRQAALRPETAPAWLSPFLVTGGARPAVSFFHGLKPGQPSGVARIMGGQISVPPEGYALLRDIYDSELQALDKELLQLLQTWQQARPVATKQVVAVASDHGENLGEHGLLEHGGFVYSQLVDVPLVISAPGRLDAGSVVDTPVQLYDLLPTLGGLAGVAMPEGLAGQDLRPVITGASRPGAITAAAWPAGDLARLLGGRFASAWRLYRDGDLALLSSSDGAVELYDLSVDPAMETDLGASGDSRAASLSERAAAAVPLDLDRADMDVHLSPEEIEQLRALGYIGP
ncbi:MAG: sulfatase-like hydrolase/transferase [Oligoflexia bacterium]|nr:sulfatase-like hydrolase/transferase [Oligoflexia bacterium]